MIQKLEQIIDIIDEASAMIVLKEPEDAIFDKLHKATELLEAALSEATKAEAS